MTIDGWGRRGRVGKTAFRLVVAGIYLFLLATPLVVVYYSFSPGVVLRFPPEGITTRWYVSVWTEPRLVSGIWTSVLVAGTTTAAALLIGVPAAYALARGMFPGRRMLAAFFLSPLILPGLVLAIGILMLVVTVVQPLTGVTLVGRLPPLLAAHLIVTLPWVIRLTMASLETSDRATEEAARGLGATPVQAFFLVTLPEIRPGVAVGAIFAFIVSFGNFALSLFFASGRVTTLPVAIFEYVDRFQDPTVAAVSTLVIVLTTLVVLVGAKVGGLGERT